MSNEVTWQEPPPRKPSSPGIYAAVQAAMKQHPGRWALIRTSPNPSSASTTAARFKAKGFETRMHKTADGVQIYAHWPTDDDPRSGS